jgi:hypothetical protein
LEFHSFFFNFWRLFLFKLLRRPFLSLLLSSFFSFLFSCPKISGLFF